MADAFEEQAVLVAAEQAAAEGDTIAAEGHLRTLLELQTARLGPEHEEVASTLHNLAVVCERAGRLTDAEGLYRKAFAVASASLPATDSLVVRCRDDMNAFLEARMMPLQTMRPADAADATSPIPAAPAPPPPPAGATPASGVRPPAGPSSSGTRKTAAPVHPSGVRPPSPSSPPSGTRQTAPSSPSRQAARPASRSRVQPPAAKPSSAMWLAGAVGAVLIAIGVVWVLRTTEAEAPGPAAATTPAAAPAAKRPPAKKTAPAPSEAPAPAAAAPAAAPAEPVPANRPTAAPATSSRPNRRSRRDACIS
jgi:hypothetical protein